MRHRGPPLPNWTRRVPALLAATTLAAGSLVLPAPARADTVSTEEALADATSADRAAALLARDDLRAALAAQGVPVDALGPRVAALTDAEARALAARIDEVPAGGDVLGLVFTGFVILLVTDILGLTRVFPFTRPIR